jgi:protein-export SecD/SecF family membrane protein
MKKKRNSIIIFIAIIVILSFLALTGLQGVTAGGYRFKSFGELIKKGLDLQGGVSVVMEVQAESITSDELETIKNLLDLRVNRIGVSETVVTTEGEKRVRIDIPGVFNSSEIVQSLSTTGVLTFKDPDKNVILTGSDIARAAAIVDQNGAPTVSLELNAAGATKFAEATEKFKGKQISINMDEEMISNPVVNDTITDGKAIITGMDSLEEAQFVAGIINSGALPYPVKAVELKTVGPTLGANAIPNVLTAAMVGLSLVVLLMVLYYRKPGVLASVALGFYVWLVLFVFYSIDATLSLAGIAGFLLTIGMAVDANVLIFERIKEELEAGADTKKALDGGFHRALSSILDSNFTTIIAGLVLYFVGTGAVKGFALTLMIGIVVSMFSAIVLTKGLLRLGFNMGFLKTSRDFGVKETVLNEKI